MILLIFSNFFFFYFCIEFARHSSNLQAGFCVGNVFQMTEPASTLLDDDALELENEEREREREREKDEIWGEK